MNVRVKCTCVAKNMFVVNIQIFIFRSISLFYSIALALPNTTKLINWVSLVVLLLLSSLIMCIYGFLSVFVSPSPSQKPYIYVCCAVSLEGMQ